MFYSEEKLSVYDEVYLNDDYNNIYTINNMRKYLYTFLKNLDIKYLQNKIFLQKSDMYLTLSWS